MTMDLLDCDIESLDMKSDVAVDELLKFFAEDIAKERIDVPSIIDAFASLKDNCDIDVQKLEWDEIVRLVQSTASDELVPITGKSDLSHYYHSVSTDHRHQKI